MPINASATHLSLYFEIHLSGTCDKEELAQVVERSLSM